MVGSKECYLLSRGDFSCKCKEQPPKNWSAQLLLKRQGTCKQTKTQSQLALWKIAGKILEILESFQKCKKGVRNAGKIL